RKCLINFLMVGVKDLPFKITDERRIQGVQIYGGQSERLKAQESSIVCPFFFQTQQFVFQTDPMFAGDVDAGFIGGDHAGTYRYRICAASHSPIEAVWSFVYV